MSDTFIRFSDLQREGIINNRVQLMRWCERLGFPPGTKLGPNTRVWRRSEVDAWVASRPQAGKQA